VGVAKKRVSTPTTPASTALSARVHDFMNLNLYITKGTLCVYVWPGAAANSTTLEGDRVPCVFRLLYIITERYLAVFHPWSLVIRNPAPRENADFLFAISDGGMGIWGPFSVNIKKKQ
jgi:hypothetical protein